jgi:hypothetical protein
MGSGASDHWYDQEVRVKGSDTLLHRFTGKVESGTAGRTDPWIRVMRHA